jgi:type II secretory pathway pseudopilin PulG
MTNETDQAENELEQTSLEMTEVASDHLDNSAEFPTSVPQNAQDSEAAEGGSTEEGDDGDEEASAGDTEHIGDSETPGDPGSSQAEQVSGDSTQETEFDEESEPRDDLETEDSLESALREQRRMLEESQRRLAEAHRERQRVRARRSRTVKSLSSVDAEASDLRSAKASLREWVGGRAHSFAWKLLSALQQERDKAEADFAALHEAAGTEIGGTIPPPSELQDRFMKKVLTTISVLFGLFALLTTLKYVLPPPASQLGAPVNPLSWPVWVLALVLIVLLIILTLVFLTTYYRETSQRRHALAQARAYLDYLEQVGSTIKEERNRLDSLHVQIPDYLRYLSEVLHRPWQVPSIAQGEDTAVQDPEDTPERIVFDTVRPTTHALPSLMRIAEPPPGSGGAKEQALVRETVQLMLRPGWRFDALVRLLSTIEKQQSLPQETLAAKRVDQDPRLREAVMKALDESDVRREAGRAQLRALSQQIQLMVLDDVHPPVKDLMPDPLEGLLLDEDMIGDQDRYLKEWDSFLAEPLGSASSWSPLNFSVAGMTDTDIKENVEIVAFGPDRLRQHCHSAVSLRAFDQPSVRPIELTVRIERSRKALGPGQFRVFDGLKQDDTPQSNDLTATSGTNAETKDGGVPNLDSEESLE